MNRLRAGREQQRVVRDRRRVLRSRPSSPCDVDAASTRPRTIVDVVLGVESVGAQRDPLLGRVAGEIVLREVRAVVRRVRVVVDHVTRPSIAAAAQHLGRGAARGARADDDDARRRRRRDRRATGYVGASGSRSTFLVTTTLSPRRSTCQHATGESAGARSASPVRRLKHA